MEPTSSVDSLIAALGSSQIARQFSNRDQACPGYLKESAAATDDDGHLESCMAAEPLSCGEDAEDEDAVVVASVLLDKTVPLYFHRPRYGSKCCTACAVGTDLAACTVEAVA